MPGRRRSTESAGPGRSSTSWLPLTFRTAQRVPDPMNGVDELHGVVGIDFLPQGSDVEADRIGVTLVIPPDPLQDVLSRQRSSFVSGQRLEQRKFARGQ